MHYNWDIARDINIFEENVIPYLRNPIRHGENPAATPSALADWGYMVTNPDKLTPLGVATRDLEISWSDSVLLVLSKRNASWKQTAIKPIVVIAKYLMQLIANNHQNIYITKADLTKLMYVKNYNEITKEFCDNIFQDADRFQKPSSREFKYYDIWFNALGETVLFFKGKVNDTTVMHFNHSAYSTEFIQVLAQIGTSITLCPPKEYRNDYYSYQGNLTNGILDILPLFKNPKCAIQICPTLCTLQQNRRKMLTDKNTFQQIYYGAPGTGKSHIVKRQTEGESLVRITFHPDSDYSTFVGCYKPTTKEVEMRDVTGKIIIEHGQPVTENRIIYQFVDQAFLQAYIKAWKFYAEAEEGVAPKKQFLIIEEINRGNCAQIFGDLFQLLDRNDSGSSEYFIHADKDMQKHLSNAFKDCLIKDSHKDAINSLYPKDDDVVAKVLSGEILLLPNNLYIWATMNTSDQSLFPIDSAFKRRWDWKYRPIVKGRDEDGKELNWRIAADTKEYDWWSFLVKINEIIGSTTNSEDKKLGFFFCKPTDGVISAETFVGKVIFYLWNDVFKDFGFDEDIFHDEKLEDGTYSTLNFNKFYTTTAAGETIVLKDKVEKFLDNLKVEEAIIDDSKSVGNFSLDGVEGMTLGEIAKQIVTKYAQNNLGKSAQEIRNIFVEQCKGIGVSHIVETEEEYHKRDGQASQERSASVITIPNGEKLYVTTQWRAKKDSDNFIKFIDIAGRNGWGTITPSR